MPRPDYPEPVVPTLPSPLYAFKDTETRCGITYRTDVEIRYPYQGTDVFSKSLPPVWDKVADISRAYPELEDRIATIIEDTSLALDAYRSSGDVDETNFDVVDEALDRAAAYVEYCTKLREYWDDQSLEYVDSSFDDESEGRGWMALPLMPEAPAAVGLCQEKVPEEVARLDLADGQWVEFKCPGLGMASLYATDWSRYKDTLVDAAKQARCAQEILYSVVGFNVNRRNAPAAPTEPFGPPRPVEPEDTLQLPKREDGVEGGSVYVPPEDGEQPAQPAPPTPVGWSNRQKVGALVGGFVVLGGVAYLLTRGWEVREPNPLPPRPPRTKPHRDAAKWAP